MLYLETHSTEPEYNLAFEEYVLHHRKEDAILILWQNNNSVIIGQNQNALEEINQDYIDRHNISVVRRITGGGAVYHDLGNLNYSFISDVDNAADLSIAHFAQPVINALTSLGLDASLSGRNDILLNKKKISGTAQRIAGSRILHHGTLLFDSDLNMISEALNVDPCKFTSKSTKSVKSRVCNIRPVLQEVGHDMTLTEFKDYLKTFLHAENHQISLSEKELMEIQKLRMEKYDTWEWNFGKIPEYDFAFQKKFDGGIVKLHVSTQKGIITSIKFYGDFLSVKPLADIEMAFLGRHFDSSSAKETLRSFPLKDYFGTISLEELVSMFR